MLDDSSKKSQDVASSPKQRKLGIAGALFWGVLIFTAPAVVLAFIAPLVTQLDISGNFKNFIAALIYELLLIAGVAAVLKFYKLDFKAIGFSDFNLKYLKTAGLAFLAYMPLSILFLGVMSLLFPINMEESQDVGFANLVGAEYLLTFFVLVILTPFAEEFLFRGLIFTGFRNKLPFWFAAVLVSVFFAAAHWQLNVAIDVFVMSMISCFIREKSGSLWPSIFLHVFKNSVAFLLLFVFKVS
ncbi:MAG TPA: type II CAAX endopeptidase family protein [Candidatus Saccharimonadales bacterium]|nr:type II CAAX endopeptidase family protein [Candidatus Saccharimonadales bacterium]